MEILSNEPQRYPGARVTDEIYLFMFNVQPLIMKTFELEHDFENEDFSGAYDQKRIVADAEKAFVKADRRPGQSPFSRYFGEIIQG